MDAIKHNCPCNKLHKTITLLLLHNGNSSFQRAPPSVRVREGNTFISFPLWILPRKTDCLTSALKCFYSVFVNKTKSLVALMRWTLWFWRIEAVASIVLNTSQLPSRTGLGGLFPYPTIFPHSESPLILRKVDKLISA